MSDKIIQTPHWKSLISLIILQAQNAFNDNIAKAAFIALGVALYGKATILEYVITILIIVPFLCFIRVAGWVSDKYDRTWIIRIAMITQIVVFAMLIYFSKSHFLTWSLVAFFILALQSAILSPAKKAITKDLSGPEKLSLASGLIESTNLLAICVGQIIGMMWFNHFKKEHTDAPFAAWLSLENIFTILLAFSLVPLVLSFILPPKRHISVVHQKEAKFAKWSEILSIPQEHPKLFKGILMLACFYGIAGYINLLLIRVAKELAASTSVDFGPIASKITIALSLGLIAGSVAATILGSKKVRLWIALIGSLLFVFTSLELYPAYLIAEQSGLDKMLPVYLSYFLAAATATFWFVPVNAYIQQHAPAATRGRILSLSNALNCVFGIIAVILCLGLQVSGFNVQVACYTTTVLGIVVAYYIWKNYLTLNTPEFIQDQYRLMQWFSNWWHSHYKIPALPLNHERIIRDEGVLLTPNHVNYADVFFLSTSYPRRIRFVMDANLSKGILKKLTEYFNTLTIRPSRAKEAIKKTIEALQEGSVIGFFPEGRLSRSGALNEIQKGVILILRKSKSKAQPIYVDGSWITWFGFSGGKYFKYLAGKRAYPTLVNIGEPIDSSNISQAALQTSLSGLANECIEHTIDAYDNVHFPQLTQKFSRLAQINAHRLHRTYCIANTQKVHFLIHTQQLSATLQETFSFFQARFGGLISFFDTQQQFESYYTQYSKKSKPQNIWIGSTQLINWINRLETDLNKKQSKPQTKQYVYFINEDNHTHLPASLNQLKDNNWHILPSYQYQDALISLSMPLATGEPEPSGWAEEIGEKEGTWGRILPGISLPPTETDSWELHENLWLQPKV